MLPDPLDPHQDVVFYGARHGEKNSDGVHMSAFGERQVIASAKAHLADIYFHAAFNSGLPRSERTVQLAILENRGVGRQQKQRTHPLFSLGTYATPNSHNEIKALEAQHEGRAMTVREWMDLWDHARWVRPKMIEALMTVAQDLTCLTPYQRDEPINVLVGGHSPFTDLAVPNPESFPRLLFADVVKYTIRIFRSGKVGIIDANYLPCPLRAA